MSLRGKGIVGVRGTPNVESGWLILARWGSAVLSTGAVIYVIFFAVPEIRRMIRKTQRMGAQVDDQDRAIRAMEEKITEVERDHIHNARMNLAFFCRNCGLVSEAEEYLSHRLDPVSYWAEADKFCSSARSSDDSAYREKVIRLLETISEHGVMGRDSESIVLVDLALTKQEIESEMGVKKLIERAYELSPHSTNKRLALEPSLREVGWVKELLAKKEADWAETGKNGERDPAGD